MDDISFSYIPMSGNMRLKLSAFVKEASVKHVMRFSKRIKRGRWLCAPLDLLAYTLKRVLLSF